MKQQLKYVNFYKRALMEGCLHGFTASEQLSLWASGSCSACAYLTPMFDTQDEDMTYHRLCIDGDFTDCKLEVIVAATQQLEVFVEDAPVELDKYMANPAVLPQKKAEALLALAHIRAVNTKDILLHELQGRYVWVFVRVMAGSEAAHCEVRGMRLEFPKYSFTAYFPEIYQQDDFFERFIGIFQSNYLDLEARVDEIPQMMDYQTTTQENVEELAGWLGIDNSRGLFSQEQLKYLIAHNDVFQGGKGTRRALEEMLRLVTGVPARIVEHFQWDKPEISTAHKEINSRLYGETSNHFCIILDLTQHPQPLAIEREELERLIDAYCMVGTDYKLVYLHTSNHTDTYSYLDVNSCLSVPETAMIDQVSLGSHITVG